MSEDDIKTIRDAAASGRVEFASQEKAVARAGALEQVIDALITVFPMRSRPWISDESTLSDFLWGDSPENNEKAALMAVALGIEVNRKDYLVDIADRLLLKQGSAETT